MHSLHLQAIHLTSGWLYFWGTESDLRHKRCTEISKQILRSRCKVTYTKTRQLPRHRRIEPLCLRYGWLDYQNVWVCYEGTLSGISSSVLTLPLPWCYWSDQKQTTVQNKAPNASGAEKTNPSKGCGAILMSGAYSYVACDIAGGSASESYTWTTAPIRTNAQPLWIQFSCLDA